jgi:hypothetical protein
VVEHSIGNGEVESSILSRSTSKTARVLGISDRTVRRDWLQAKAFLFRELQGS